MNSDQPQPPTTPHPTTIINTPPTAPATAATCLLMITFRVFDKVKQFVCHVISHKLGYSIAQNVLISSESIYLYSSVLYKGVTMRHYCQAFLIVI